MFSVLYNLYSDLVEFTGSSSGVQATWKLSCRYECFLLFYSRWNREVKGKSFQEKAKTNSSTHGMYTVMCIKLISQISLVDISYVVCPHWFCSVRLI